MRYVCRMWTRDSNGWTSDFAEFETEREAFDMGEIHMKLIKKNEYERMYEIYKKEEKND